MILQDVIDCYAAFEKCNNQLFLHNRITQFVKDANSQLLGRRLN
jgi:hypothetical protein